MISNIDPLGGGTTPEPNPAPATAQKSSINPLDTANHFEVVAKDGEILFKPFSNVPHCRISREKALNLAAWLIVMVDAAVPGDSALSRVVGLAGEIRKK